MRLQTAHSGEDAIALLENASFDLVITDLGHGACKRVGSSRKNQKRSIRKRWSLSLPDLAISPLQSKRSDLMPMIICSNPANLKRCISGYPIAWKKLELKRRIKIFEDILPVCCVCKKIRDDSGKEHGTGKWMSVEKYIHSKAKIEISSTYCPECEKKTRDEMARILSE